MSTSLITHCGARVVTREDLAAVPCPPATTTWFPVSHQACTDAVLLALADAGFQVERMSFALSRNDHRLFSVMDLQSPLVTGVQLAIGIHNSLDKSLPLGFAAGSRVFCCDNLAFRGEIIVARKHTRNGQARFTEAIQKAVQSLTQFRTAEAARIRRLQQFDLTDTKAESVLLKTYEQGIISHRQLPDAISAWRKPKFEEFQERTGWALYNALTTALAPRFKSNPQQFASLTVRMAALLDTEFFGAVEVESGDAS